MHVNKQNNRAVVTILGMLAAFVIVVCSGLGMLGYLFVTGQAQQAEAQQQQAEAKQAEAAILREQQFRQ